VESDSDSDEVIVLEVPPNFEDDMAEMCAYFYERLKDAVGVPRTRKRRA
jgi:hypothetical protein